MRPAARPRVPLVTLLLALAGLGSACSGGDDGSADPGDAGIDTPAVVADTQLVMDSTGVVLEIITSRRTNVREVVPRAGSGDPDAPDVVRALPPETVHSLLQGASPPWYVIDVRDARAYATEGHLPGALLVPLEILEKNVEDLHVRTDQVVLVYGGEDDRARRAARLLASYGFPTVRILAGGLPAWKRAGLPVEGTS